MEETTPNDAELGAKVREYLNRANTCCDKKENMGTYIDAKGKEWGQCKVCGKILT